MPVQASMLLGTVLISGLEIRSCVCAVLAESRVNDPTVDYFELGWLADKVLIILRKRYHVRLRRGNTNHMRVFLGDVVESMSKEGLLELSNVGWFKAVWTVNYVTEASGFSRQLNLPLIVSDSPYSEGGAKEVNLEKYERDPLARMTCLEHWGLNCVVCGFNFAATYGTIGEGYIHVHHLCPVSLGPRNTDPLADLRPVCPNCHAMLHQRTPPLTIEELKLQLSRSGQSLL